jgi:P-type Cu+ transporter
MEKQKELNLRINGMHCAGCAAGIEKQLSKVEGIKKVQVNFATETAAVEYEPSVLAEDNIFSKISEIGYQPQPENVPDEKPDDRRLDSRARLIMALVFTVPIILINAIEMIPGRLFFRLRSTG